MYFSFVLFFLFSLFYASLCKDYQLRCLCVSMRHHFIFCLVRLLNILMIILFNLLFVACRRCSSANKGSSIDLICPKGSVIGNIAYAKTRNENMNNPNQCTNKGTNSILYLLSSFQLFSSTCNHVIFYFLFFSSKFIFSFLHSLPFIIIFFNLVLIFFKVMIF